MNTMPSLTSTPRTVNINSGGYGVTTHGHRNAISCGGASPWLSAVPRSNVFVPQMSSTSNTILWQASKRKAAEIDDGYDGEESASESANSTRSDKEDLPGSMEKKAAWLLMNLSVRDIETAAERPVAKLEKKNQDTIIEVNGKRELKRRRALSM
jgi:hypothetical protein